jgi:hypothetical protein
MAMRAYSWNDWNIGHIARHNVTQAEARYVVERAQRPYPQHVRDGKWCVRGKTAAGRWLQVVYVYPDDANVDPDSLSVADLLAYSDGLATIVYIIHARDLTDADKRQTRKRGKHGP